jgi:hypothetical protein
MPESLPSPEQFRDAALKRFQSMAKAKFDIGQREHGGNIVNRILVDEAEKEVIDLWYYLQGIRYKLGISQPFDDV